MKPGTLDIGVSGTSMLESRNELSTAGLSEQQLRGQHFKIGGVGVPYYSKWKHLVSLNLVIMNMFI